MYRRQAYLNLGLLSCHGLGPAGNKATTQPLAHSSPLGGMGRRKYNERLLGRDQDREGSLTNYGHRQNRLDLGKKNKPI